MIMPPRLDGAAEMQDAGAAYDVAVRADGPAWLLHLRVNVAPRPGRRGRARDRQPPTLQLRVLGVALGLERCADWPRVGGGRARRRPFLRPVRGAEAGHRDVDCAPLDAAAAPIPGEQSHGETRPTELPWLTFGSPWSRYAMSTPPSPSLTAIGFSSSPGTLTSTKENGPSGRSATAWTAPVR